ncbi:MAG TPA: hypothetical protein PLQ04_01385 [Lachnospiraceae bacterium]|nr:hypothetical protein [Lachnospiraceae bacterium]
MHKSIIAICLLTCFIAVIVTACDVFFPELTSVQTTATEYSYTYVAPTPMPTPIVPLMEQTGLFETTDDMIEFALLLDPNTYSSHVVLNTGVPIFTNSDFERIDTVFTSDIYGRPASAFAVITIETIENDVAYYDIASYDDYTPLGWSDSIYVRRIPLISENLCEYRYTSSVITGTKTLKNSMSAMEDQIIEALENNPDLSILYCVTPVYVDNNLLPNGLIVEAFSIEDAGETICICDYLINNQSGRTVNYATGEIT